MQIINIETVDPNPNQDSEVKDLIKGSKIAKREDEDINHKSQLNDRISRLQAMIQNFVSEGAYSRFKNDVNEQIEKLNSKIDDLSENLECSEKKQENLTIQHQVNTNSDLKELKNCMNQIEEDMKNEASQNERKNNILNAKI